jgi:hypothetical protein
MGEAGKHAIILEVGDILDRLGLSRESISHVLEGSAKIVMTQPDRNATPVQNEYTQ